MPATRPLPRAWPAPTGRAQTHVGAGRECPIPGIALAASAAIVGPSRLPNGSFMKFSRLRLATNVQIFTVILVVVAMMALVFTADRGQRQAIVGHAGALLGDRVEASGDVLRAAIDTLREDVL